MTDTGTTYMPLDRQLFDRTIAEVLASLLGQRYGTAKHLARALNIETSTAENLRKGHLSVPTLEKALKVEGRDLWNRLGDELFGETDQQYEARRIAAILSEAENAITNLVRLSSHVEDVPSGAGRLEPDAVGRSARSHGRQDGAQGSGTSEGPRDRYTAGPVEDRSFAPKRGRK